MAEYQ